MAEEPAPDRCPFPSRNTLYFLAPLIRKAKHDWAARPSSTQDATVYFIKPLVAPVHSYLKVLMIIITTVIVAYFNLPSKYAGVPRTIVLMKKGWFVWFSS